MEGNPNASAYSAAKAGLIGFTKSLAKETAHTGILVNAVAPGIIETPLLANVPQERIAYMLSRIPMGRMGTADEVAAMIAWLCSCAPRTARSRPARCSTFQATARPTEQPKGDQ